MTETDWMQQLRSKERYAWMSDDQWECAQLLFDLVKGEHHLTAKIKPWGDGIEYNTFVTLATYDFSNLTDLVVLAHDRCIRVEIAPASPRHIKIIAHKRHRREGGHGWERHPELETGISLVRARAQSKERSKQ